MRITIGFILLLFSITNSAMGATSQCHRPYQQLILQDTFVSCQAMARRGNERAQFLLGLLYFLGDGGPEDIRRSVSWLAKAGR